MTVVMTRRPWRPRRRLIRLSALWRAMMMDFLLRLETLSRELRRLLLRPLTLLKLNSLPLPARWLIPQPQLPRQLLLPLSNQRPLSRVETDWHLGFSVIMNRL